MDIQSVQAPSAVIFSQEPLYIEKTERCGICNETLGLSRPDGRVEEVFVLPCSHTFGSQCITRWLEHESANRDCPQCRRRMVYRGCGHAIKPCEITRAPKCVGEKDMPEQCVVCRGGGELEEQVRMIRERQLAVQRALEGMKMYFPGIMGGMCRSTMRSVDGRVEKSREVESKEIAAIYAELEGDRDLW